MPSFSKTSKSRLKQCDTRLRNVLNEAIKYYDFSVLCGHRGKKEQDDAFNAGASKVKYPNSKHNKEPSLAVDVAPYPISWEKKKIPRFFYLAGLIMGIAKSMGVPLRWGHDWDMDDDFYDQGFNDAPHFEIKE
jgi:peptidoglycan L-alanyl-D-glutamate endopeptidase CwlK